KPGVPSFFGESGATGWLACRAPIVEKFQAPAGDRRRTICGSSSVSDRMWRLRDARSGHSATATLTVLAVTNAGAPNAASSAIATSSTDTRPSSNASLIVPTLTFRLTAFSSCRSSCGLSWLTSKNIDAPTATSTTSASPATPTMTSLLIMRPVYARRGVRPARRSLDAADGRKRSTQERQQHVVRLAAPSGGQLPTRPAAPYDTFKVPL